jgi:hypothetical protein
MSLTFKGNTPREYVLDDKQCNNLVQTIKDKKTIINPLTKCKLSYSSPITKALLSYCFHYKKNKDVLDIVSEKQLFTIDDLKKKTPFYSKTTNVSNSPMGAKVRSSAIAVVKSSSSPRDKSPHKSDSPIDNKNIDLEKLLNEIFEGKDNRNKNSLSKAILQYKESCGKISKREAITLSELIVHIQLLLDVFYNCLEKFEYNVVLIDNESMNEIEKNSKNIKIDKDSCIFELNQDIYHQTNPDAVRMIGNKTMVEYFLDSKCLSFNLIQQQNGLAIKYKTGYTILFKDIASNKDLEKYIEEILLKCFTGVPKYHYIYKKGLNTIQTIQLRKICNILNTFTENINKYIRIVIPNGSRDVELRKLERFYSTNTPEKNKDILTCLMNNSEMHYVSGKARIEPSDVYYNNEFLGAYRFINPMYYLTFQNKLKEFQPIVINMMDSLKIETSYKGVSPLFSKDLNQGLQKFISPDRPVDYFLPSSIEKRIQNVLSFTKSYMKTDYEKEPIYVYHGTKSRIHSGMKYNSVLLSFLSTTFNVNTAVNYATRDIRRGVETFVYVFKVKDSSIYINFMDQLFQILLLVGTEFVVKGEIKINDIVYVMCEIINDTKIFEYNVNLSKTIELEKNKRVFSITTDPLKYHIKPNSSKIPMCIKAVHNFKDKTLFNEYRPFIYRYDKYIYTSYSEIFNSFTTNKDNEFEGLKYTIHQIYIKEIRSIFTTPKVIPIDNIIYESGNDIMFGWIFNPSLRPIRPEKFEYKLESFVIDCLLGFKDCANSTNYLSKSEGKDMELLTMISAGLYMKGKAPKVDFDDKQLPIDHFEILEKGPGLKELCKSKRTDLETSWDNFVALRDTNIKKIKAIYESFCVFVKDFMFFENGENELKDVLKMITDLNNALLFRYDFYVKNKEEILKYMFDEPVVGGKAINAKTRTNRDKEFRHSIDNKTSNAKKKTTSSKSYNVYAERQKYIESSSNNSSKKRNDKAKNIERDIFQTLYILPSDAYDDGNVVTVSANKFKKYFKDMERRANKTALVTTSK